MVKPVPTCLRLAKRRPASALSKTKVNYQFCTIHMHGGNCAIQSTLECQGGLLSCDVYYMQIGPSASGGVEEPDGHK